MDRDFKGVWIDKKVWLDNNLNAIDKVIFTEIDSLDNENHCTASNEYLADFCQCSISTVTRSIKKLIELGYIKIINFNGRKRIIQTCLFKMTNLPSQNDEADSSKCTTNNIYNNIYNNNEDNNKINNKNIFDFFEENLGRTLAPIEFEKIKQWEIDYNRELIDEALKRAIMNNKKNLNYINAILINWKTQGYNSLQEVKDNDINHFKESSNNKNIELFDYNWFDDEEIDN